VDAVGMELVGRVQDALLRVVAQIINPLRRVWKPLISQCKRVQDALLLVVTLLKIVGLRIEPQCKT